MATFLEIVKSVARESGTISDLTAPATVSSQSGRLLRMVNWTADAYADIQRRRDDWRWMRKEFSGQTIATVQSYAWSDLSITERFKKWKYEGERGEPTFSIYKTADGQSGETWLIYRKWDDFRRTYLFGSAADDTGPPAVITVDPQDNLVLGPIPDAAYTLRGQFCLAPQILSGDDDVPEMPAAHHDAIKWQALVLMGTFDEAPDQMPAWVAFLREHMAALERTQTPRVSLAGPLA